MENITKASFSDLHSMKKELSLLLDAYPHHARIHTQTDVVMRKKHIEIKNRISLINHEILRRFNL